MSSSDQRRGRGGDARTRTKKLSATQVAAEDSPGPALDSWVLIYAVDRARLCERTVLDPARATYLVGRGSQCDIVLDSAAASRTHCRLELREGRWWVVDLASLNGVYVNDARVHEHPLCHGERVQVGDTIFKHLTGDNVEAAYLEALRAAVVTDGLTQAANERAFRDDLARAVRRARAADRPLCLALLDVDHFKAINDAHGHPGGDRVLRELVRVLRGSLPGGVTVGRVGGEEFGVLFPAGTALDAAAACVEAAREAVAGHAFAAHGGTLPVTVSFGIAQLVRADADAPQLFARADRALYAAKAAGRNRLVRA